MALVVVVVEGKQLRSDHDVVVYSGEQAESPALTPLILHKSRANLMRIRCQDGVNRPEIRPPAMSPFSS